MSRAFVDAATQEAISRAQAEAQGRVRAEGPVLEVYFPSAAHRVDVAHGLGVVPTGYRLLLEVNGSVRAADVTEWTDQLAYLQSSTGNTRARLYFILTEPPTRVPRAAEPEADPTSGVLSAGRNIDAAALDDDEIATVGDVEVDTLRVGGLAASHAVATFRGQYTSPLVSHVSPGATVTVDCADGNEHYVELDEDCALTFANPTDGGRYIVYVVSNGHALTWDSRVRWAGGTAPTLTADGALDLTTHGYLPDVDRFIGAFNLNYDLS